VQIGGQLLVAYGLSIGTKIGNRPSAIAHSNRERAVKTAQLFQAA